MSGNDAKNERIEVTCPKCGAVVSLTKAEADRDMKVKCPKGHEVALVKMM